MLRVGIIGLGVGEAHIEGYHKNENCQVVALCDFQDSVIERAREKYPQMQCTKQADEILTNERIDVVSIASYDQFHAKQIIQAFRHGKHVFVEKPLCLSEREAREIYATWKQRKGLKLSSNLILRRSPRFIELKERIQRGEFGTIYHVDGDYNYGRLHKITEGWRSREPFHSVFFGGGVHITDLFTWLLDDRVDEVSAYGNQFCSQDSPFQYNDNIVSLFKFKSGVTAKVSANYGCVHPHFHMLQVFGTQATFLNGFPYARFFTSRDPDVPPQEILTPYPGVRKGDLLEQFVDSILEGHEPSVGAKEVFDVMAICFAVEQAVGSHSKVKVNYLWPES